MTREDRRGGAAVAASRHRDRRGQSRLRAAEHRGLLRRGLLGSRADRRDARRRRRSTPMSSPASTTPGSTRRAATTAAPVVGIGEAAFHLASLVAGKFSVVTTLARSVPADRAQSRSLRPCFALRPGSRQRRRGARPRDAGFAGAEPYLRGDRPGSRRGRRRGDRARLRRHGRSSA